MLITHLFEAGIMTADVDRGARRVILSCLDGSIDRLMARFEQVSGMRRDLSGDPGSDDWSRHRDQFYDAIYQFMRENMAAVVTDILTDVNAAVTPFVRRIVKGRFGEDIYVYNRHDDKDARIYVHAGQIVTKIECYQLTTDPMAKKAGGYFSPRDLLFKVFVDEADVSEAVRSLVTERMFGESDVNGPKQFCDAIIPTFVHEYAHLEQTIRGKREHTDRGYITVGGKRAPKVDGKREWSGKRGGYARETDTNLNYIRYLASFHEIDSHAAGAAAELVSRMRERRWGENDINSDIDAIRQDIAQGYGESRSLNRYRDTLYNVLNDAYPDVKFEKPEEFEAVWRRFLKLLWQKLGNYYDVKIGGLRRGAQKRFELSWIAAAQKLKRAEAVASIARDVAFDLSLKYQPGTNPEWFLDDITESRYGAGEEIYKAQSFLREWWFGDNWDALDKEKRLFGVFRRMVMTHLREMIMEEAAQGRPKQAQDAPD